MTVQIDTTAENAAVRLENVATPSAPATGHSLIFSKGDGLYYESASGTVIGPMSTGTMDLADPYGIFHRLDAVNSSDDEFNRDSSANYTAVNPAGSVTWSISKHVLSAVFNGQGANQLGAFLKAATISDGQAWETCLRQIAFWESTKFSMSGLVVTDGTLTTSNAMALMAYIDFSGNKYNIEMWKGTLSALSTAGTSTPFGLPLATSPVRIKMLRNSSTSWSPLVSTVDGAQFNAFGAAVMNPGFTPSNVGLFVSAWGNTKVGLTTFDYLRVV